MSRDPIRMEAKYEGWCRNCKGAIHVGELIDYQKIDGKAHVTHPVCPHNPEKREYKPGFYNTSKSSGRVYQKDAPKKKAAESPVLRAKRETECPICLETIIVGIRIAFDKGRTIHDRCKIVEEPKKEEPKFRPVDSEDEQLSPDVRARLAATWTPSGEED